MSLSANDGKQLELPRIERKAPTPKAAPKRCDIQGLRAWAIILVLLYHFYPKYFPNGYIGVDIFFVISGYLIAMIVCKLESIDGSSLKTFYYRRVKRIFPLYYLMIALIFIAIYAILPESFYGINARSGQRALFLITNLKFAVNPEQDYQKLLQNAEDLFTHSWSLCVEIQWYFLVPLLFLLQKRVSLPPITFFTTIGCLSLVFHLLTNDTIAFNCVLARIWQFCAGISALLITKYKSTSLVSFPEEAYKVDVDKGNLSHHDKCLLPYIGYLMFGLMLFAFSWLEAQPAHLRIEVTFLTTTLIVIGEYHELMILSNPITNFVGDISYSLYLVHWPIYVIFKHYYGENMFALTIGVIISLLLSIVIYYSFETQYLKLSPKPKLILVALLFGVSLVLTQSHLFTKHVNLEEKYDILKLTNQSLEDPMNDPAKNLSIAIALNHLEGVMEMSILKSNAVENCTHIDFGSSEVKAPFGLCQMPGNHTGKLRILVMGNSWACNQGNVVHDAFKHLIKEFYVFCMVACEPLLEKQVSTCNYLIDFHKVFEAIKPDVMFIVHRPLGGKEKLDEARPIEEDEIYQQHLRIVNWFENHNYLKRMYILQALPTCVWNCAGEMNIFMDKENKSLSNAGDRWVNRDEKFERIRLEQIGTVCHKCKIFDYLSEFLNRHGQFTVYDDYRNLAFVDDTNHLTKFGREKVRIVYERLAQNFTQEFPELS